MGVMQVCVWVAESIVSIVSYVFNYIKVGCAWAWTTHTPWYLPGVCSVSEFIIGYKQGASTGTTES